MAILVMGDMVFMGDMYGGIVRKLVRAKKFRLFL